MKTLFRLLVITIAAAAFLAMTQRSQINAARTELKQLEVKAAIESSKVPLTPPVSVVTSDDISRLRAENRDIHKLRGQITQAREKRRALEQMQGENAQLREKIDQIKANPNAAAAEPFPLSNRGQATPEAALETTFWSMYRGDIEALTRVMPMMTREFERMPLEERTNSVMMLRAMATTIGKLEISDRKFDSSDEAHLTVRITPRQGMDLQLPSGRDQTTFVLRRTNDLWQVVAER
jgi:hypothetical protein